MKSGDSRSKSCLVFDLDDTIIFDNMPLSSQLADTIESLAEQNFRLVFATARSLRGVRAILPDNLLRQYLILCNGAFAVVSGTVIDSTPIEKDIVADIAERLQKAQFSYVIECGSAYYHPPDNHRFYDTLKREAGEERLASISLVSELPVYKISVLDAEKTSDIHTLRQYFERCSRTTKIVTHTNGSFDVVSRKASKWNCLSSILDLDEFSHVKCFGNDENDLEMFENISDSVLVGHHRKLIGKANRIIKSSKPKVIENQIVNILMEVSA